MTKFMHPAWGKDKILEYFRYHNGKLIRIKSAKGTTPVGAEPNAMRGGGNQKHLVFTIEGKTIAVHRAVWCIHHAQWPEGNLEHINGDTLDNRIENLRMATPRQKPKSAKRASNTGHRYIYKNACGSFTVKHKVSGKTHQQTYLSLDDAKAQYQSWTRGDSARADRPGTNTESR